MLDDLRQILREKDPECLPAEEKFLEALANFTEKLEIAEVERYVTALDRQICSDLVYADYLGFQTTRRKLQQELYYCRKFGIQELATMLQYEITCI